MEINKIHNMDCRDGLKQLPDDFAQITITSPPYNLGNSVRGNMYQNYSDDMKRDDYYGFIKEVIEELIRTTKYYVFFNFQIASETRIMWMEILHKFRYNIKDIIIWHKKQVQPSVQETCLSSAFEYVVVFTKRPYAINRTFEYAFFNNREKGQLNLNVIHGDSASLENNNSTNKAIFPEYFVRWFVDKFTKEGDIIMDCFSGSGTTSYVAQSRGRNFIGFEKDPEQVKYSMERLSQKSLIADTLLKF